MKRMLSGIKPTGELTLGNYLGALKHFVNYQDTYEMFVFIANLHTITVYQDPKQLAKHLKDAATLYLASGLDPEKATVFLQSDVLEHTQLSFILSCNTYLGEMNRMTQYKDKVSQGETNLTVGFYSYPTLMAADILLYDADFVPVGNDQKQHVEITRDIAERFNNRYSKTFVVPEPLIPIAGARIMSLSDPTKKMSKSDEDNKGVIYMLDSPAQIKKKIMAAKTDSLNKIQYNPEKQPGISNLIQIMAACQEVPIAHVVAAYEDANYGTFKKAVAEVVIDTLAPIQARYHEINQSDLMEKTLAAGKAKAQRIAAKKLVEVQKKIGIEIRE
jgi:tryptophanyl-tRNA synthetase